MKVVAVINQKGGVGKTTTTANLCHALAQIGYKVTAIDFDPQGQLAISLGVTAPDIAVLMTQCWIKKRRSSKSFA